MHRCRCFRSLTFITFLLTASSIVGCSSQRKLDEAEMYDYLKSVSYEEQIRFDEKHGTAGAPASDNAQAVNVQPVDPVYSEEAARRAR